MRGTHSTNYRHLSQIELQDASCFQEEDENDAYAEEELEEDRNMPLTANREAKWYSSAFHNVTAMVGAELVHLHEVPHPTDPGRKPPQRLNRYHELTQHAWGVVRGSWAILPFQVAVMVGLGISYTVTGGNSLTSLAGRHGMPTLKCTHWIVVFSAVEVLLAMLPSLNHLSIVSLMGALMSLVYSCIAIVLSIMQSNVEQQPSYSLGKPGDSGMSYMLGVFNAVSTVAFAFGGHNVALEIQASLPCPPSTVEPMMMGVNLAYVVTFFCYFGVTIAGYATFGNSVSDNVLDSIGQPLSVISLAELCVVLHVAASYQVYSFCIWDMMQQGLWKRGVRLSMFGTRAMRVVYVAFTCFVAVLLPFFGDLMGLVGAIGVTPTTFLMPAILWLYLKKPEPHSFTFCFNWAIICVCCMVGLCGTIASLQLIVHKASQYTLFS